MRVIIVAGGVGLRMKTDTPKQFLELSGKPVLIHSLMAFADVCEGSLPVVVMCHSQLERWKNLCKKHNFTMPHRIVGGGATRFYSVKNGLSAIPDEEQGLVAVHDAVRPLVSRKTIEECIKAAKKFGCAVPAIPVVDTVREVDYQNNNRMIDRAELRLIQTPQIFDIKLLKKAYKQEYTDDFTDCASVFERAGNKIYLTEGNVENIKITTAHDLKIAEALLDF